MWRVSTVLSTNGLSTSPIAFTEAVSTRGVAIHSANEALADGYDPTLAEESYRPFVDGLKRWYRDFEPVVIATERRIVSRAKRLTGQVDTFALIPRRQQAPYIIDVKSGQPAPWHGMQTAGYKDLVLEDHELWKLAGLSAWSPGQRDHNLRRAIIYLPGDGTYKWKEQDDPSDHWRFSAALGLMQWRHDHGLLTYVDPEVPPEHTGRAPVILEGEPF